VITRTLGVELTVLDTTDPQQVRAAIDDRLDRTVVVVSSKSGGTVETDSHRRAYHQAFLDAGLSAEEAGRRFVVVTDPGSPLEAAAAEFGARAVFLADATVGGRYSALTAFGLVPSALAGVDVAELLDQAADVAETLGGDGPALALGAALGAAARDGRDKLVIAEDGSGIVGLGDWAEQLVAESTGKDGKGLLPVVVESPTAHGVEGPDVLFVTAGGSARAGSAPDYGAGPKPALTVNGPLGGHFLAWEYATAVAGRVLGIDPFDQPNVAESKENTGRILTSGPPETSPTFTDGAIEVYGDASLLGGASDVADALTALLESVGERGYLAVLAYLDRAGDADAARLRALLAERTSRPVTFGWGPRFLHSTGQYHKGGPQVGVFLQLTGAVTEDLPVPGKPYTFGVLQAAQAAGDLQALSGRGRQALRLHLTDRAAGIAQLVAAFR
jgi:glucose-6-phosphate isomerase